MHLFMLRNLKNPSRRILGCLQFAHGPSLRNGLGFLTKRTTRTVRIGLQKSDKNDPIRVQKRYLTPGPTTKVLMASYSTVATATTLIIGLGLTYILYENDYLQPLPCTKSRAQLKAERLERQKTEKKQEKIATENVGDLAELPFTKAAPRATGVDTSAWANFSTGLESFTSIKDVDWATVQENFADFILPDWAKNLPDHLSKLQCELSMAPGSLAGEIWRDAQDPEKNPEILLPASVRVSQDLCDEEKDFLKKRRVVTRAALASYLGIPEEEIHPDDVPTIAMVGSGGGLRALVAGTGSLLATHEAGLFQCVTYTAGVSGSCWMQALYHSSLGGRRFDKMVNHLKARLGTHIAYPPVALAALNSAPTNKFLLRGFVEKLKGDPNAEFGIVDVYGLLLAARLLVPKGELGVDNRDLKISNQRENLKNGEHPMPIYTAVRHEIPIFKKPNPEEKDSSVGEDATVKPSEAEKELAKKEAWFQWFEISPYEMFCEEFSAGIPTWAMGRKFKNGEDLPQENGLRVPELKLPLLLGVFGSAMCATLSHYAREMKPVIRGILPVGFTTIQEMIEERNDDLSKVHPIGPASIPNFCVGMQGRLPETTPESIFTSDHLQLMDAGMSNNLPIYSCLRPGRDVDILIAFDASADIKTENWLQVTEGYALQRGIKGWPLGAGWPKPSDTPATATAQLDAAQAATAAEVEAKLAAAKAEHAEHMEEVAQDEAARDNKTSSGPGDDGDAGDLGYCSVWVGSTEERAPTDAGTRPKAKAFAEDWQLMEPDAGIAVVYFPFLANARVAGVDPAASTYMSTWNFVYAPEEVQSVVELARANFEEGGERTRRVVRAVYERKRKARVEREGREEGAAAFRRRVRLGVVGREEGDRGGHGDHFS